MTVPSATVRANSTGDGTAGPITFPFKIQDEAHLTVVVRDTTDATDTGTTLVLNATNGYTVTGVGLAAGGSITLTGTYATSVTSDFKRSILHTPTKTQTTDTRNKSDWYEAKAGIEDSLDKLTNMSQSLQDQLDRSLTFSVSLDDAAPDALTNGELPVPSATAFPRRNSANTGWEFVTTLASGTYTFPAVTTDNALIKSDGTDGLSYQATGIIIDDSNNVSGMGTLSCGTITTSGTVDGRDVASDGTQLDTNTSKLSGIETGADVTDSTNVNAAGATMNTDTTLAGNGYFLDEDDMASDSATKVPSQQSVKAYVEVNTSRAPDIILQDQKSSGTAAGSSSSGVNTRVLNTEVRDVNSDCTLSSNQFTLAAGDYYVEWSAPAFYGGAHQTYLYNTTGTATVLTGTSMYSATGDYASNRSTGSGVFTIAASQALDLRHYITSAKATDGLGPAVSSSQTLIYAEVRLWRLS